jgi:hypothetical protein
MSGPLIIEELPPGIAAYDTVPTNRKENGYE